MENKIVEEKKKKQRKRQAEKQRKKNQTWCLGKICSVCTVTM